MTKKVSIGVDVGGTNTAIGVVDQSGNVMVKDNIATPSHGDIDKYISDLALAIKKLIKSVKLLNEEIDILGIGIGAPTETIIPEALNMHQTFRLRVLFIL